MELKFHCTSCGLCCRNIGKVIEDAKKRLEAGANDKITEATANFPHSPKPDGSCEKLDADGRCSIYDTRPDICSVEKTYDKLTTHNISKKRWFSAQGTFCNMLIRQAGLSKKFLVKVNY